MRPCRSLADGGLFARIFGVRNLPTVSSTPITCVALLAGIDDRLFILNAALRLLKAFSPVTSVADFAICKEKERQEAGHPATEVTFPR